MNKNYKILIVEDARLIALHLTRILENAGYNIVGRASNTAETIELVNEHLPDLIMMDIMLSGSDDGIETMKMVQEIHDIPVIYLTALTDRTTVERAKETRPYGYIIKPFQTEQVITLIEMAIHKYNAESLLIQSEKKFKAAVSAMTDAFIFLDEEFKINHINKAAEELTGHSLAESAGQNFYDIVKLIDFNTFEDVINIWKGGPDEDHQKLESLYIVDKTGRKIPIGDGVISKVRDQKGILKGVVITFRDISDRIEEESKKKEFEKKQLSAIIEGQEQERSRIARELHDGMGQVLNAIKLHLSSKESKEMPDKIREDLKKLIDEAIQETSRIAENLLPSKLKNFDIVTCIFSLTNREFPSLNVSFEATNVDHEKIGLNKKINIYRITQELITNCIKHAGAQNLFIQLRGLGSNLVLTVEDDGVGFDFSQQKQNLLAGHNGLQNIIDRINIMNGSFEVDSKKGHGTLVISEIPYDK